MGLSGTENNRRKGKKEENEEKERDALGVRIQAAARQTDIQTIGKQDREKKERRNKWREGRNIKILSQKVDEEKQVNLS